MEKSIFGFNNQFDFEPQILGEIKTEGVKRFIVGGMGGSHLSADILKVIFPTKEIIVHTDYGLPNLKEESLKESLFIASSYSGNTEETLDFMDEAYSRGFNVVAVTTGGELIKFAKENNVPYVLMPKEDIQPRVAIGYSLLAMALIIEPTSLSIIKQVGKSINVSNLKDQADEIAKDLNEKIPVIYSSLKNSHLGYLWKIKFNETAKIPAFSNCFPELNHNEAQGFDFVDANSKLSENFAFIFLKDQNENLFIEKRMKVLDRIFQAKGFSVINLSLIGQNELERILNSMILADWTSLALANHYSVDPQNVPLIEEFKKQLKNENNK